MNKVKLLLSESLFLIKKHKYYFLTPIIFFLSLIAIGCVYFGPSVVISFIYAGI